MGSIAILAHRGSPDRAGGIPENTLAAFDRARRLGADGVELDVRLTSDGGLAVHHDPVVPGVGAIADLNVAELPASVPLLAGALESCAGLEVNIEIKNLPGEPGFDPTDRVAIEVVELVVSTGRVAEVVISSFWPDTLGAVRTVHPGIATGLLLSSWFDPVAGIALAVERGCTALHPHVDLAGPAVVDRAHAAGLSVAAWTVNDPSQLAVAGAAGVDTVITDDVVLAALTLRPDRPGGAPGGRGPDLG
jgi:glycerophosphoryl diester phosphodiesterase